MDIRDIKQEVPNVGNNQFEEIFRLQVDLCQQYKKVEGLPDFPISLDNKEGQKLIKDFIARVIEELGEAWESYETLMDMFHTGISREDMIPHLQNFNEELADALHFHMELLIYSGITISDIMGTLDDYRVNPQGIMGCLLSRGKDNYLKEFPMNLPSYKVIKDEALQDEFLRGGRDLSKKHEAIMERYLWRITHWYQMSRNTLKNKPWKQTHMLTDKERYRIFLIRANEYLFGFFWFVGMTPDSIFHIYYKKNLVNQFRIRSKY